MPGMPPQLDKFLRDLDNHLKQPGKITNLLGSIETKTGIKRLYIVGVLVALQALYLLFGGAWAQFICNVIGFIYPAYASLKAIESHNKDDDTQWLTYWVVFAFFSIIEFFSKAILYYLPFYFLLKCIFLFYLYMPMTNGAQVIYVSFIRPIHQHHAKAEGNCKNSTTQL